MAAKKQGSHLFVDGELELPDDFRPYTPPGARAIRIPNRIAPFRPVHEHSRQTKQVFDRFFEPTKAGIIAREKATNLQGISLVEEPPEFPAKPLPMEDPKANNGDLVEGVLHIEDDGTLRYLNLKPHEKKKDVWVALDDQDRPLLADDRKNNILVDEDGYELPAEDNFINRMRSRLSNSDGAAGSDNPVVVYTEDGIPLGDFDVVAPGHAPSDGKGVRGRKALGIAVSALGVAAVVGLLAGVGWGRTAVPAEGQITEAEAKNYHLSQYPVEAASAFGQHYLTLCLTHPQYREDTEFRSEMMAGMEAAGVPENCGWEKGGAASAPTSVVFNGEVEERPEYSDNPGNGEVAYLSYLVTMQDGRHFTATVPVWAGMNEMDRQAFSIVGTVGMTAATALNASPDMTIGVPSDRELVGVITPTLNTFFNAWAESDDQALEAILSSTAVGEARAGMDGAVGNPDITSVVVYPDKAPAEVSGGNATWEYGDGDTVVAMVNLSWNVNDGSGGHAQPAGYRVSMVYDGGKWEVSGLQNGVVVADGASTSDSKGNSSGDNTSGNIGGGLSGGFGSSDEGDAAGTGREGGGEPTPGNP